MNPNTVVPVTEAPALPPVPSLVAPTAFVPTVRDALGGRADEVPAAFDFDILRLACSADVLWNPAHSTGCSPILRELLQQTGLAYKVKREIFDDGNPAVHQGGNALDISSPDLAAVARLLRVAPQLFDIFAYQSQYPADGLFVVDGTIVEPAALTAGLIDDTGQTAHMSSSSARLLVALHGAAPAALIAAAGGQFTKRDVYAVLPDTSAANAAPSGVQFW